MPLNLTSVIPNPDAMISEERIITIASVQDDAR